MEHRELTQLIAARALDALDPDETTLVDEHVETCEDCRRELDDLREVAGALAFAAPPLEPPAALRGRILAAAAPEAPPAAAEAAPARRRGFPWRGLAVGLAGATAVLAVLAITLNMQLGDVRDQRDAQRAAIAEITAPDARLVKLEGGDGALLGGADSGVLVLKGLGEAPSGKTYQAWIIPPGGGAPRSAGTFQSGGDTTFVELDGSPAGAAMVAVTVEPEGGSDAPTTQPFLVATL